MRLWNPRHSVTSLIRSIPIDRENLSTTLEGMRQQFDEAYKTLAAQLRDVQACLTAHQEALATGQLGLAMFAAQALRYLYMEHMRRLHTDLCVGAKRLIIQRRASAKAKRQKALRKRNSEWILKALDLLKNNPRLHKPKLRRWTLAGMVSRCFQESEYAGNQKAVWHALGPLTLQDPQ